jgi:hypothetical protein
MGKSKKKKGMRSRKPFIRHRLTRKIKKIMLRGGKWITEFDGKLIWVPDKTGYDSSYSGTVNSYANDGRQYYPSNQEVEKQNAITKTLRQLQKEEEENRSPFYPYRSLKEKEAAEAVQKNAAMKRIEEMKRHALQTEEARLRRLGNGSQPPSYESTVMADAEKRRQEQIKLILDKTKDEDKKAERRELFKNMSLDQIHDWIRNRNRTKKKRSNEEIFYDAEEDDEFYDAREFGGGLKRRIVKSRRLGKKRLTLKRRLQNKKASLK